MKKEFKKELASLLKNGNHNELFDLAKFASIKIDRQVANSFNYRYTSEKFAIGLAFLSDYLLTFDEGESLGLDPRSSAKGFLSNEFDLQDDGEQTYEWCLRQLSDFGKEEIIKLFAEKA